MRTTQNKIKLKKGKESGLKVRRSALPHALTLAMTRSSDARNLAAHETASPPPWSGATDAH